MKIIQGKKIADRILADLERQIKIKKIKPCLAVILVGNNPASNLYVRLKEKAAQEIGIKVKKHLLASRVSEKAILKTIESLNQDAKVNGILVQLPLPKNISADKIIQAINPKKDVDGFLPKSRFEPPFILAIWQAIKATKESLKNKKAIALVNSDIFGQTLCRFLEKKGLRATYSLQAIELPILKTADIVVTALGQASVVKGNMIKQGTILIDGGISKKGKKVIGDIDAKSVNQKAGWLSPVPGGLGPLTVALMLKNVILAATS